MKDRLQGWDAKNHRHAKRLRHVLLSLKKVSLAWHGDSSTPTFAAPFARNAGLLLRPLHSSAPERLTKGALRHNSDISPDAALLPLERLDFC